jgi:hypothetical protein
MRLIVLSVCVLSAACGDQVVNSPTAPSSATAAPMQMPATRGTELPFHGDIRGTTHADVAPPNITIYSDGEGTAAHLGRFTSTAASSGVLGDPSGTGPWTFTAANGDQLLASATSTGVPRGPDSVDVTTIGTITGGTGRFAGATGTFTVRFTDVHNEATATGTFSGSFDGVLNLNR